MKIETLSQLERMKREIAFEKAHLIELRKALELWSNSEGVGFAQAAEIVEKDLFRRRRRLIEMLEAIASLSAQDELDLVLHAIEANGWSETSAEEDLELEVRAHLLRCRILREEGKAPAPIGSFDLVHAGEIFDLRLT